MAERVTIEPVALSRDRRGLVVEPVHGDLLAQQRNVHLVLTQPGHVRGNHYHERGTEVTLALGPALFRYRDGDAVRDVSIARGEAVRITIAPGVAHAFIGLGPEDMVLIGFNTELHDPARPDVVRDEVLKPEARQ
jgi:dTDP-4-dehydrorhamnose 3,5-epimerase-like enzyme